MKTYHSEIYLSLLSLLFSCTLASLASAATTGTTIPVPACGSDPNSNTKMLQAKIDLANAGDTLVLPAGVCVLARCDLAQEPSCFGTDGHLHRSALYVGKKTQMSIVGAANGTSVLKLDPHPPGTPGHHAYCSDTHVLTVQTSSFITLRDFTVDGSDGELPEDPQQCPPDKDGNPRRIAEQMHDVRLINATDVVIDHMQMTKAHGDGLNLIAARIETVQPFTERVTVTNSDFVANDRSGITFQRNVGFVTIVGNYFRNSGQDQDLDMEPSGGPDDRGPYEVTIAHNLFERLSGKITVTLGSGGGVQRANGIRFTNNTIQPSPLATPQTGEGGCVFVYTADHTTIAQNTIIGAQRCETIAAQKVTDLVIAQNHLEGLTNLQNSAGVFVPKAVIDVSERVVKHEDPTGSSDCGAPPKSPCPYVIHYPDRVTVRSNIIVQQVQQSLGVRLSNADASVITDNTVTFTNQIAPVGTVNTNARAIGIDLPFGVPNMPSYGYYENERTQFTGWTLAGNHLSQFADGIHLQPIKTGMVVAATAVTTNVFNSTLPAPRGINIEGAHTAPQAGFMTSLFVSKNTFGCGFYIGPFPTLVFPLNAFVHPSGQAHTGNIGEVIPCQ